MTMRVALLAIIAGFVLDTGVHTQPIPPGRQAERTPAFVDPITGLDLDRAVAQALEQEPSLRAARSEVDIARGMRVQAGLGPNPTVSFSQQQEPAGMDHQTRVEIMWPLDLFRRSGRIGAADREIEAASHAVADRERLLAADVRMAYGEVAAAVRELTVLDDLFATTSRQHALVGARVDEGATPPLERDVLRVELQRLEAERLLQTGVVERAMIELKRLIGMPAEAPVKIRDTLEQLVQMDAVAPTPVARAEIVQTRPDIEAAASRVRVADAQIERARRDGRADVNLFGMYMRMDAGFPQRAFGSSGALEPIRGLFHYVVAGAAVTIPLRDRNQGAVSAAESRRAQASAELDAARLTAQAEIAAARVRDEHARQAVAIYTSESRSLARQNLNVVDQTYELGRATVFDVLAERRRYLEVERAFTSSLREAYEARQALRQALGDAR
jgi:cobalt-zinc-cadmium efflux system outer membrane protein